MSGKLAEHTEAIVAAYVLQGKALREIAETFGVSSGSVRTVLKKNNVVLRSRGRRPSGNVTEVSKETALDVVEGNV